MRDHRAILGSGLILAAALGAAACVPVTVNISFPQEQLDSAAGQIVDMSRGNPPAPSAPPPAAPATPPKPGSRLPDWLAPLGPRDAAAGTRDVRVGQTPRTDTEELRRLTASQNARLGALRQWKARGCIGENNQGFLEARPGQGCTGDVGRLVAQENRDRQAIIDTFMRQNNIPPKDAGRVRASFAKAYRDRAQSGDLVQNDRGQWVRK
jgi:uncharacterized protein YdbL (DUF1318 family)